MLTWLLPGQQLHRHDLRVLVATNRDEVTQDLFCVAEGRDCIV